MHTCFKWGGGSEALITPAERSSFFSIELGKIPYISLSFPNVFYRIPSKIRHSKEQAMEYETPRVTESNTQSTARVKWPRFTLIKEFVECTSEFKSMNLHTYAENCFHY